MNARWMVLALSGGLALAQWGFWPDTGRQLRRELQPELYAPAEAARNEARRRALATAGDIEFRRQADRFGRAAVDARASGQVIDVGPEDSPSRWWDASTAADARARAEAQLEAWGLEAPQVAVGFYLPGEGEWPGGIARPPTYRSSGIVIGRAADGQAYCLQIGPLYGGDRNGRTLKWSTLDDSGTGPGAFGACWLHARYGVPGPAVSAWMLETGMGAAMDSRAQPFYPDDDGDERRLYAALGARGTMGLFALETTALADRCIGGDASACRAIFVHPTTGRFGGENADPHPSASLPSAVLPLSVTANYLPENWLHLLETRYGPERMAAFWTSEADDVVTAFETAFDADLEATMMEVGRARFGAAASGPTTGRWGWFGLFGALAVGLGAALRATGRRVVA